MTAPRRPRAVVRQADVRRAEYARWVKDSEQAVLAGMLQSAEDAAPVRRGRGRHRRHRHGAERARRLVPDRRPERSRPGPAGARAARWGARRPPAGRGGRRGAAVRRRALRSRRCAASRRWSISRRRSGRCGRRSPSAARPSACWRSTCPSSRTTPCAQVSRAAHTLAFVVIANRRHTDLFEWGQRTTPFTLVRGDPTAAAARRVHLRGRLVHPRRRGWSRRPASAGTPSTTAWPGTCCI